MSTVRTALRGTQVLQHRCLARQHHVRLFSSSSSRNTSFATARALRDNPVSIQQAMHRQVKRLDRFSGSLNGRRRFSVLHQGYESKLQELRLEDGAVQVGETKIPNIWLRDNCQCASCVHEDTKQRLLDTFSIPENIQIKQGNIHETGIDVEWSDGHSSRYSQHLLSNAVADDQSRAIVRQGLPSPNFTLWDSSIAKDPPSVHHETTYGDEILGLLTRLRTHGFCYITSTPHTTASPTETLLTRLSFIRPTHYGGFYDFTADLSSKDTAYTNIALPAHTDTTYFSDPAGLQAFHLLSHTHGAKGGASLLVDGFKCAEDLRNEDPDAYSVLARTNVHAHASGNEGISIQPYRGFPVLEHDGATGQLVRVRWNGSDRAGIEGPVEEAGAWYAAARKFDGILKRGENEYWEQLVPGKVLVFDNWRVLHGRSAFEGKRRICGAYINRDDWISKYKILSMGQEKVLGSLASG